MNRVLLVNKCLIYGLLLSVLVAVILNLQFLQFERFYWWPKIVDPALIALGFLGSLHGSKVFRVIGWSGIALFCMHGFALIAPGEDYLSGGSDGPGPMTPRSVSLGEISIRLVLILTLIFALVFCFWKTKSEGNVVLKQKD